MAEYIFKTVQVISRGDDAIEVERSITAETKEKAWAIAMAGECQCPACKEWREDYPPRLIEVKPEVCHRHAPEVRAVKRMKHNYTHIYQLTYYILGEKSKVKSEEKHRIRAQDMFDAEKAAHEFALKMYDDGIRIKIGNLWRIS